MLFKNILTLQVVLQPNDVSIDKELLLKRARDQRCGFMDPTTKKELIWIADVDYALFEADPVGSLNSDGSSNVEIRCTCVLRRLISGEETYGMLVNKGENGDRPIVLVENIPMAIEGNKLGYDDVEVGQKIRVKVEAVQYKEKYGFACEGQYEVTARGAFD